ncbi:hypothetical protein OsI_16210 [Oryza sativa Indica Group]|uniref:Uncharacterized protein n=1 Tax=Oryza sativa subsp. indica TaxID=39946 RepID=A2XUC9_ORYSI|nr:hypothetical protein OsI_16210 [Oryza sativa Indica Group]
MGAAQMRLTSAARTQPPPSPSSGMEDAAAGEFRRGAWSHERWRILRVVTETAPATSSGVGRGWRRILRSDGGGTGDELRRGGRSHRLRRGRWTWPPVMRSRRRTRSPATSSDVDRGRGRMRLPVMRCLDKAAIVEADLAAATPPEQPVAALTVTEVEEAKMVVKLLPIWSTSILFWTVYSQMTTFSVEQASHMDRRAGGFAVPAGSFSVFLFLSILLFTSASERLLVPLARRLMITRRPQGLTSLQRVGAGLVLATLAMAVSALVEKKRRDASGGAGGGGVAMISAFWLVPQFFLVGAGEAFAYVGQLEFFIREAPERMKSMSTGLFLATLAMGFFLSSLLVSAVDAATRGAWIRDGLDDGRLDLFYWMLAALGVANFAAFLVFASRHQYRPAILPAADSPPDDEGAVREAATTVKGMDF